MSKIILPLFPLELVVFPGEVIPLHIFEERYKQLVNFCLEDSKRLFGISCVFGDMVAQAGCAMEIEKVATRYDDGKLDIICRGVKRYQIEEEIGGAPYPQAYIEYIEDHTTNLGELTLRQRVITLFTKYTELTSGKPVMRDFPENEPFSWKIAGLTGLSLPERQMLLEMTSEQERFQALDTILTESVTRLATEEAKEERIKTNGHFKH